MAGKLVARAGFHRHPFEQLAELLEVIGLPVVQAGAQPVKRRLILGFQHTIEGDRLAPVFGQLRPAAVATTGRAQHQRLIGQVVHGVDGVPCRFIGKRYGLRRLGNRSVLVDGFEQADARVAEETAELGSHFQLAA